MDKYSTELTIKQIQLIMDWSYPTALNFAKQHGEIKEVEGQDKYFIPSVEIYHVIDKKRFAVDEMESRFNAATENGANS